MASEASKKKSPRTKNKKITTEDILLKLCHSVTAVLGAATGKPVNHSAMVQKIQKTSLRPDLGCFVLFDGSFSGLVIINFSGKAAIQLYRDYMINMGMPADGLANQHTADEVGDVMGELMNQIVGNFTSMIGKELQTVINQNQPKMIAINKSISMSIDTNRDLTQTRRVAFKTDQNHPFFLELAMDKTEFIKMEAFEIECDINPDDIIDEEANKRALAKQAAAHAIANASGSESDNLIDSLGI
ncbi:MAG: chemotaxis protein CheY-P-specific phosphatase CheC [Pseudohongiellaceae bacterium]|jgi:chemotaxis protein CheY-P-specific phosphatase CheC